MSNDDRPENRLLAALPQGTYERIAPHLKRRSLERGTVLHRPGETIRELYFPLDCLVSVTITMRDGRTVETGVVGRREVVGINAFMGGRETTQTEYTVQVGGEAVCVPAAPLREEFDRDKGLRGVLLAYTQAMLAQISQNAACGALHHLEQRFARWLLEVHDRVGSDDLRITHEFVSDMLGVRRAGISELSARFEARGLLAQARGRIRILDATGLEAAGCECYVVVKEEYDRLLGSALGTEDAASAH